MQDVCADAAPVGLIFHNDDNTPAEFVARLLREVFGWSVRGANALTSAIDKNGRAGCGPYPPTVAAALVEEAQRRIRTAGHSLRITTETADANASEEEAFKYAYEALAWHFVGMQPDDIATSVRQFPAHMRADVQLAVDKLFAGFDGFFGIHEEFRNDLEFASLIGDGEDMRRHWCRRNIMQSTSAKPPR